MRIEDDLPPSQETDPSQETEKMPTLSENAQRNQDIGAVINLTEKAGVALSWDELVAVAQYYGGLRDLVTDPNRDKTIAELEAQLEKQENDTQLAKTGETALKTVLTRDMHQRPSDEFGKYDELYRLQLNNAHEAFAKKNTELNVTFRELTLWENAPEILERFVRDLSEGTVSVPGVPHYNRGKTVQESHTHP